MSSILALTYRYIVRTMSAHTKFASLNKPFDKLSEATKHEKNLFSGSYAEYSRLWASIACHRPRDSKI